METKDILTKLREETRPHHKSIEGVIPVMSSHLTPDLYKKVIERFYGFYKPLEEKLSFIFGQENALDFEVRKKTHLLEKDLLLLGLSDQKVKDLSLCPQVPNPSGVPSALGILYVLEGSTLGGQIISKHIHRKMGVTEENGGAFYNCYGDSTLPKWREFQEILKIELSNEGDHPQVVAMAQRTFSDLAAWMSGIRHI